jgi:sporulation protein YlmC with PRC-barrel domain
MESMELSIGAEATCTDGPGGKVIRVVVDPVAKAVTHVVVEPRHRSGLGKLVPLDLVESSTAAGLQLRCSTAELQALESAETTQFLPGVEGYPGFGEDEVVAWPYYGGNASVPVTFDTLPVDEVAVRRGDRVHATDGRIGHVEGLVVDGQTRHVTHVLLQEGHLWGRKEVAIPMASVVSVEDGIRLNITKQEVADLPAVGDEPLRRH